jgi:hypothetical protein
MIRINRSALALMGLGIVCAIPFAQAPLAHAQDAVAIRSNGETTYLTGGFGDTEISYMRENAPKYSLRMEFSQRGSGEFVSGVNLDISNPSGKSVFALDSAGPLTDVMLPPGQYRVRASYEGKTETQEVSIDGAGRGGKDISFHWKGSETQ